MERYTGPRRRPTRPKSTTESPAHSKEFAGVPQGRPFLRLAGFLFSSAPASRPCAESRYRRGPLRVWSAWARRKRHGMLRPVRRICVPGCGVRRAARRFCASEQTRTNRADLSRPCKRAGRRLWNARHNSFSAICEFHNNKSGKHFSNTFIFGIMYAVKIGLSTRFGAFQRARPRPCESTLRGGGRPDAFCGYSRNRTDKAKTAGLTILFMR